MSSPIAPYQAFRLVVSGLGFDDEDQLDKLLTGFDGDASVSGTTTDLVEVVVTTPGDDPVATVSSSIARLTALLPAVIVRRLDEELVGISDIAELAGKSRESIRLYADGKRGPGNFPGPVGVVGDNVRVWRWADVDAWLRQHTGYNFPTVPIPSWAIDTINAELSGAAQTIKRSSRPTSPIGKKATPKRGDLAAIRAWAMENGKRVSARGRIPANIVHAYDQAMRTLKSHATAGKRRVGSTTGRG